MSEKIRFYKGLYKVKVITESDGYWIVEALEEFNDRAEGEEIEVKVGERRIVQPQVLFEKKTLPPMVKEHEYELDMEKKLKKIVESKEKKKK